MAAAEFLFDGFTKFLPEFEHQLVPPCPFAQAAANLSFQTD
jgi:hypothetical protein